MFSSSTGASTNPTTSTNTNPNTNTGPDPGAAGQNQQQQATVSQSSKPVSKLVRGVDVSKSNRNKSFLTLWYNLVANKTPPPILGINPNANHAISEWKGLKVNEGSGSSSPTFAGRLASAASFTTGSWPWLKAHNTGLRWQMAAYNMFDNDQSIAIDRHDDLQQDSTIVNCVDMGISSIISGIRELNRFKKCTYLSDMTSSIATSSYKYLDPYYIDLIPKCQFSVNAEENASYKIYAQIAGKYRYRDSECMLYRDMTIPELPKGKSGDRQIVVDMNTLYFVSGQTSISMNRHKKTMCHTSGWGTDNPDEECIDSIFTSANRFFKASNYLPAANLLPQRSPWVIEDKIVERKDNNMDYMKVDKDDGFIWKKHWYKLHFGYQNKHKIYVINKTQDEGNLILLQLEGSHRLRMQNKPISEVFMLDKDEKNHWEKLTGTDASIWGSQRSKDRKGFEKEFLLASKNKQFWKALPFNRSLRLLNWVYPINKDKENNFLDYGTHKWHRNLATPNRSPRRDKWRQIESYAYRHHSTNQIVFGYREYFTNIADYTFMAPGTEIVLIECVFVPEGKENGEFKIRGKPILKKYYRPTPVDESFHTNIVELTFLTAGESNDVKNIWRDWFNGAATAASADNSTNDAKSAISGRAMPQSNTKKYGSNKTTHLCVVTTDKTNKNETRRVTNVLCNPVTD